MNNKYIYLGNYKIAGPYNYWGLEKLEEYIASLPIIEVIKESKHNWEINQILVANKNFEFVYVTESESGDIVYKGEPIYPGDQKFAMPFQSTLKPNSKEDDEWDLNDFVIPLKPKKSYKATMTNIREVDEHGNPINPVKEGVDTGAAIQILDKYVTYRGIESFAYDKDFIAIKQKDALKAIEAVMGERIFTNEDMENRLIDFAKWFNLNQWIGGKGDYQKGLFVKQDFKTIIKIYLNSLK